MDYLVRLKIDELGGKYTSPTAFQRVNNQPLIVGQIINFFPTHLIPMKSSRRHHLGLLKTAVHIHQSLTKALPAEGIREIDTRQPIRKKNRCKTGEAQMHR
ncbi:hypothetical protein AVEN_182841-1 [Araneus ventricosus]|uniref:EAL domain-containing protein n=1 Tax=Araneus ventricosus TaxID=182803 RepID=A0A4Y2M0C2_ARAVE|nr:hypothetical protein AVEN_182841-1 [Araneus ventricosus]